VERNFLNKNFRQFLKKNEKERRKINNFYKLKKEKQKIFYREICAKKVHSKMDNAKKGHNNWPCHKVVHPFKSMIATKGSFQLFHISLPTISQQIWRQLCFFQA